MKLAFDLAESFLKNQKKPAALDVFLNWKSIVGPRLAKITKPYKTVKISQQNILVITAQSGYELEIQHETWEILRRVNVYMKKNHFTQIKVIHSS